MAEDGLELDGFYIQVDPADLSMRIVSVFVAGDTLVVRACDDPSGRLSMILSHMTHGELKTMMACIGTECMNRKTA